MNTRKQKFEILMLSSEKASLITLLHGKLYFNDKLHGSDTIQMPQHLYVISNDEIKEGDWYILESIISGDNKVLQRSIMGNTFITGKKERGKKIVATTDTSLHYNTEILCIGEAQDKYPTGIHKIHDSYVKWFIDKANDSGVPVDYIYLEMEEVKANVLPSNPSKWDEIKTTEDGYIVIYESDQKQEINEEHFRNFLRTYHLTSLWEKFLKGEIDLDVKMCSDDDFYKFGEAILKRVEEVEKIDFLDIKVDLKKILKK